MRFKQSSLGLLVLIAFACTDHRNPQPTKEQILTNGRWYVTQWLYTDGTSPAVDFMSSALPCKKDDYFTFASNNAFTQNEGTTECDKSYVHITPASVVKGGWKISSDQQKISFTYAGQSMTTADERFQSYYFFPPECTILQLDESTFVIQGNADQNGDGRIDVHVITFKKQ